MVHRVTRDPDARDPGYPYLPGALEEPAKPPVAGQRSGGNSGCLDPALLSRRLCARFGAAAGRILCLLGGGGAHLSGPGGSGEALVLSPLRTLGLSLSLYLPRLGGPRTRSI